MDSPLTPTGVRADDARRPPAGEHVVDLGHRAPLRPDPTASAVRPGHRNGPPLLVGRDLGRVWGRGRGAVTAIAGIDITILPGEIVAVTGPSGSGKSTLGAILAGIDRPTSGSLRSGDLRLDRLDDDGLAAWRAANVGIVFQDFHLLPTLTANENVQLALRLAGVRGRRNRRRIAADALRAVGLGAELDRVPSELSGGQQQRVGVARAMAVRPRLLVADEPTGSLDRHSGEVVFDLLLGIRDEGTTVVFITHDEALAAAADRVVEVVDGTIVGSPPLRRVDHVHDLHHAGATVVGEQSSAVDSIRASRVWDGAR